MYNSNLLLVSYVIATECQNIHSYTSQVYIKPRITRLMNSPVYSSLYYLLGGDISLK